MNYLGRNVKRGSQQAFPFFYAFVDARMQPGTGVFFNEIEKRQFIKPQRRLSACIYNNAIEER